MRNSLFALLLMTATTLTAEKPFDFASTPGKLPKNVVPEEYAIRIMPNMAKRAFTGSETIKLNAREAVKQIVLNSAEIKITKAAIDGKALPVSAIKLDDKEETLTLTAELTAGNHQLELEFTGIINQRGVGLYDAPYQEHGTGAKKVMLGTQFEATDARRMFPCWDEPSFRARFQLTAVVPENFVAVSNMPVEKETKVAGGKELRFGITPPMASYLNVFCAGELDAIQNKKGEVTHGVVATKGKAEMGRYALESSQQILDYFNDYFGIPYPLPKLDHIAVPGGFGGAMENWGGITYYESALLFDPERSSAHTRQAIYEVVAHETAHMWFGDLVTMAWWDNLWLNEGFASWMGTKVTAKFNPDWEVWLARNTPRDPLRRHGIGKEAAMEGDARSTTHPIQQPIKTEAEANSAFDDITYRKGMSFIRMLESFLGEDVFRDGIRRYMAAHKFSNTTTTDLWNALGEASGKPVAEIAAAWTEQPGLPVVKVARDAAGKITLTQERFTVHFEKAPPLEWKIPLTYAVPGEPPAPSVLMTSKQMELPGTSGDRAIKLNVEGAGNYRVQYDEASWTLLLADLPKLSVPDRVNLLTDAWAMVQANRAPLSLYLGLVEKLPTKTELAEREQIMLVFDFINRLLATDPNRAKFQKYARSILQPSFAEVGWEPKKGEPVKIALLRASLIKALGELDDKEIVAGCRERFEKYLADSKTLAPDLRPAVLAVVGRYADEATWKMLHELGLKTTSIEEKATYYNALSATIDPKLAARTLEISLGDELPTSRATYLVSRVARESEHPEVAWTFAKGHMKQLLAKTDALTANSYAPGLFTLFSDPARIAELERYAKSDLPASAARDVAKASDEVGFRADMKSRVTAEMSTWLTYTLEKK
ncbi:MAG TPA: M1 family metallopeptidase [Chthoniobacterales bacterium]|nr:M1 family metallopeptidase [Chthoniobacterales bacterium]